MLYTKRKKYVHVAEWKANVSRTNDIRGNGRNKLRTYCLFKFDYEVESYCKILVALPIAKFRCGVAPLKIETGRYEGLVENDRLCPCCSNDIEDESHVILKLKAVSLDANFQYLTLIK